MNDTAQILTIQDVAELEAELMKVDADIERAGFAFAKRILDALDIETFAVLGMKGRQAITRAALEEYRKLALET